MKKFLYLVLMLVSQHAVSTVNDLSLGVVLGMPTGLSGKYKFKNDQYLQSDLSTNYATLDFMLLDGRDFDIPNLRWLYGGGAVAGKNFGARGVTSVEYDLPEYPFHGFASISMSLVSDKNIKSILGLALGARYDF